MATADRRAIRTGVVVVAAIMLALPASSQPAAAGGLFETLFGFGRSGPPAPPSLPPQTSAYADPYNTPFGGGRHSAGESSFGHGTVFCVRTCDGRYFPMQRHAGASPAETCRSFCPASKTVVFSGSKIDSAVAQNGTRYADLDTAFAYRDSVVQNCTCNGQPGGLAHLDTMTDPTLRPGDIVASDSGFATFTGGRSGKGANFTPINPESSAWARHLSEVKVRPAPPEEPAPVAAADIPIRKGRLQAAR